MLLAFLQRFRFDHSFDHSPGDQNTVDLEQGWPERDFPAEARDYLLTEARLRVPEQLNQISAQITRAAAIAMLSLLLVSASGIIGDFRLALTARGVLTALALAASLVTMIFSWLAYRGRTVSTGVNVTTLARSYKGATARELSDAALETLTLTFERNSREIEIRARWLSLAIYASGVQGALLFAAIVARSL